MCAIAGFCNLNQNFLSHGAYWRTVLDSMNQTQKHRGPDRESVYLTDCTGLAHVQSGIPASPSDVPPIRRILDGGEFALCFHGSIYNADALRQELKCQNAASSAASAVEEAAAELFLSGYLKEGIDFVRKCEGCFSFALWDSRAQQLLLCRDRLGTKPFFYTLTEDSALVFGPEPKVLFAHPDVFPALDKQSLQELFGLGPARTPGCGVFSGIKEILPGHLLCFRKDGLQELSYWVLESRPHEDSPAETIEKTAVLLQDAVSGQMRSDVPISTFLSGGIDSSLVTSICAKSLAEKGGKLRTFSFDFIGNDEHFQANAFQPSTDRPHVDTMLRFFKETGCETEHIYLECDYTILADWLTRSVDAADLPCMADIDSSLLYFCSRVSGYSHVALTGECADEIFGGYPWFHKKECFDADIFPWSMDMSIRSQLLKDDVAEELALVDYAKAAYHKALAEVPILPDEDETKKRRREISYLNLRWFMATLMNRMDRTSMAFSLDARVPFADHRIVEYLWNVPWNLKCYNGQVKGLLREAGKGLLPESIRTRKKSPYPKTYHPQYEALLKMRLRDVLASPSAPLNNYIDSAKAEAFLVSESDYARPFYGQLMAGPQLIAYLLQMNYWLEKY